MRKAVLKYLLLTSPLVSLGSAIARLQHTLANTITFWKWLLQSTTKCHKLAGQCQFYVCARSSLSSRMTSWSDAHALFAFLNVPHASIVLEEALKQVECTNSPELCCSE
eukprot:2891636-Amphidinium_carterae.1